jgi:hypothetical protein
MGRTNTGGDSDSGRALGREETLVAMDGGRASSIGVDTEDESSDD